MERNTLLVGIAVLVGVALLAVILAFPGAAAPPSSGKLKVVASFYPLYDFARNVGGERAEVSVLIPPGVSPHHFEASPSSIRAVSEAGVFVYNGAGLEPWVPNLLSGVGNTRLVAVDASAGIPLIASEDPDEPGNDPHVWLDPVLAEMQVDAITAAFVEADPEGKSYYEGNAAAFKAKLGALDEKIRAGFSSCRKRDVLITHATLAYFCKRYGCRQIPLEGVNEEGEPSPAELAAIVDQARERNVTAVFFESLINPASAQALAGEIGGRVLVFNTVHGLTREEEARGEDYLSLMEGNLENIKTGLGCE